MAKKESEAKRRAREEREWLAKPHTLEELDELDAYVNRGGAWEQGRWGQAQIQKLIVTVRHLMAELIKEREPKTDHYEKWLQIRIKADRDRAAELYAQGRDEDYDLRIQYDLQANTLELALKEYQMQKRGL